MTKELDNSGLKIGRAHRHLEGDCNSSNRPYEELVVDAISISQNFTRDSRLYMHRIETLKNPPTSIMYHPILYAKY